MPEFEAYLERLRASLEVSPRRAEEILAEALSHLETKAAELEEAGRSREEAVREAVQDFGEPAELGERLAQANHQHGERSAARAVAGAAVMGIAVLSFAALTCPTMLLRRGLPGWLSEGDALFTAAAGALLLLLFGLPVAFAAGGVVGRRLWWVAGVPVVLYPAYVWGALVAARATRPLPVGMSVGELTYVLAWLGGVAVAWMAAARLGAAVAKAPAFRHWALFVIGPVYAAIGMVALGSRFGGANPVFMTIAFADLAVLVLLVGEYRAGRIEPGFVGRCTLAAGVLGGALIVATTAAMAESLYLARFAVGLEALTWAFAATGMTLVMMAALIYFRRVAARVNDNAPAPE